MGRSGTCPFESRTRKRIGGVAKWSTAVDSNARKYQLLFEGAGSNPVSVVFLFARQSTKSRQGAHGEVVIRSLWVREILGSIPGGRQ